MDRKSRRCILAATILLSSVLLANEPPTSSKALVTVRPEQPGVVIPPEFLGLSYEKSVLADTHFRPDNTEMVNLYRNLGGGVLRFGGNRVETTYWIPANDAAGKPVAKNAAQAIGPAALDNLYAFAKKCDWRVIHGLNLGNNVPTMSADEAAYALKVGGPTILAFEVGNEPDFYPKHDLRPKEGYEYAQYRKEAEAADRVILARSPEAPLAGPATTERCTWFNDFVTDFKGHLALATSHGYSLSSSSKSPKSPKFASVENLLSAGTRAGLMPMIEEHQKVSHDAGIPFRFAECNSVSDGGTDGVSDVFASALWGTDFLFDVAERGVSGINFHGGFGDRGYTAFCFRKQHYHIHPLYYCMLLFHQAARGRIVPVECQSSINVTAHAVLGDDGKLRVVLVNKDLTQSVDASVAPGSPRTKAEVIRLTAPSVTSKDGVTLAGSAVGADGTWTPQPGEAVSCVNGGFEVSLPAASAASLTID